MSTIYKRGDLIMYTGKTDTGVKRGETYEFENYYWSDAAKEYNNDLLSFKGGIVYYESKYFKLVREAKVKRLLDEIDGL